MSRRKDIYITDVKEMNIKLEEARESRKTLVFTDTLKNNISLTHNNLIAVTRENLYLTMNKGKSTYQYHFNLNGENKIFVNPRVVYATFKRYVHFKDIDNPYGYSSTGILFYNDKFNGKTKAYSYDLNSSYSNAMINCDYPDMDKFVGTRMRVGEDEIGFVDVLGNVRVVEKGELAEYVYKKLPRTDKLYEEMNKFVMHYYEMKKNATTQDDKMKAKNFLNFAIGCLQNHNWMFRTCILSYANKIITDLIEKYEEHVIYCNTDNITLDIPIELDIGKNIGQFKVEHENEYVKKKGSAIQWENKLIYRGITSSRLKDDFDLLTDELTYTKPTKYKFNSEELRIDENN